MSLYIGNSNSNNKLLHITKDAQPVSTMKSDEVTVGSTTFHSSLSYLLVVGKAECPITEKTWWNGQWNVHSWSAEVPNNIIDLINEGYVFDAVIQTMYSGDRAVSLSMSGYRAKAYGYSSDYDILYGMHSWFDAPFSYGDTKIGDSSPSYTNRYLKLENSSADVVSGYYYGPLYPSSYYDNRQDVLTKPTAQIIVYNVKYNTEIELPSTTNSILLNSYSFVIGTNKGLYDMANFNPVEVVPEITNTSFSHIVNGTVNLNAFLDSDGVSNGWKIEKTPNTNEYSIEKKVNNSYKKVISNSINYLAYAGSSEYSINLTAGAGKTDQSPILTNLGNNEVMLVALDGITWHSWLGNTTSKGFISFIDNEDHSYWLFTVHYTRSGSTDNGVYSQGAVQIGVSLDINKNLQAKLYYNFVRGRSYNSSFSGKITVFKFRYAS